MTLLFVTGLPGSDHDMITQHIAVAQHWRVIDTDDMAGLTLGMPMAQAIVELGEEACQDAVTKACNNLPDGTDIVCISSNAVDQVDAFVPPSAGRVVFCDVGVAPAMKRLGMQQSITAGINPRATWLRMAATRREKYAPVADYVIDTSELTAEAAANQVVTWFDSQADSD